MNDFSPKARYLKSNKDEAETWLELVNSPVFQNAATHAFAEMGFDGATKEELKGARDFIANLMSIAQPFKNQGGPPRVTLHQTSPPVPEKPKAGE